MIIRVFLETLKLKQRIENYVIKDGKALVAKYTGTWGSREQQQEHAVDHDDELNILELRDKPISVKKLAHAGLHSQVNKGNEVITMANLRGNLYEIELDLQLNSLCQRRLGHFIQ